MKKIISLLLTAAFLLAFAGCTAFETADTSVETEGLGNAENNRFAWEYLYNKNGEAVQIWIFDGSNYSRSGVIYELMEEENGSSFVYLNTVDNPEQKTDLSNHIIEAPKLLPTQNGENAYHGERIVNLYYKDFYNTIEEATPVFVVTDKVNDFVRCSMIEPIQCMDGEFFIISDGQGNYTKIPVNREAPEEMPASYPNYPPCKETLVMLTVDKVTYDDAGNPVKADIALDFDTPFSCDVFTDTDGKHYFMIETVQNETLYVTAKLSTNNSGDDDFGMIILNQAVIPLDIIKGVTLG